MSNLTVFKSEKDKYIEDANAILQEFIEKNCEAVLIVAMKDDKVIMRCSPTIDSVKKLGMIEAAKLEFFMGWK